MENLVYRFLNHRVCKDYGLGKIKEVIRQSNPRQKLIDDVKEMHYITEEALHSYHHEAAVIVHDSMSLYPIDKGALINALMSPQASKSIKVPESLILERV
jgi:KaiC/GvpD/RAD55 family RecA-like ATPase